MSSSRIEGYFGPYMFEHLYKPPLGHRVVWHDEPREGDQVLNMGTKQTILYVDRMGKIVTEDSEGHQSASFPDDLTWTGLFDE